MSNKKAMQKELDSMTVVEYHPINRGGGWLGTDYVDEPDYNIRGKFGIYERLPMDMSVGNSRIITWRYRLK